MSRASASASPNPPPPLRDHGSGLTDEACAALLSECAGLLRRLTVAFCRDEAEREDLAQDMMLAVWRGRAGFRGESSATTWVYRVAVRVALQRLRHARARPIIVPMDGVQEPAAADARAALDARHDLLSAMAQLGDTDRAVLALHLEDRSHAEIAAVIGGNANAIGVRLLRIRERLRVILGEPDHA